MVEGVQVWNGGRGHCRCGIMWEGGGGVEVYSS